MVKRYPDTITLTEAGAATQDSKGNWTPGSSATRQYRCRWEMNMGGFDSGMLKPVQDGVRVENKGIVYMPVPESEIALGTKVTITGTRKGVPFQVEGSVSGFSMGSFNARVWL